MKIRFTRLYAGIYAAKVNGIDLNLIHNPNKGCGYDWVCTSSDQDFPDCCSRTKAGAIKQVEDYFNGKA